MLDPPFSDAEIQGRGCDLEERLLFIFSCFISFFIISFFVSWVATSSLFCCGNVGFCRDVGLFYREKGGGVVLVATWSKANSQPLPYLCKRALHLCKRALHLCKRAVWLSCSME